MGIQVIRMYRMSFLMKKTFQIQPYYWVPMGWAKQPLFMHWPMKWDLKVYYILLISSCEKVVSKKYSISKGRSSTKPWLFRVIFLKCFFLYSDDDIYIFVFLIVLEVNASSSRNGRQVLTNLREATQSHDVRKRDGGTNNLVWQKQSSQQESNGLFFQFVLLLTTYYLLH